MTTAKIDHAAFIASLSPNVLAFLNNAYAAPPSAEIAAKLVEFNLDASKLLTPKAPKGRSARKAKGEKSTAPKFSLSLPSAGSIDYAEFLCLLRDAGMRQAREEYDVTDEVTGEIVHIVDLKTNKAGESIMVFDRDAERRDQRDAIAAYIGYDMGLPHGTQLDNARLCAGAEMRREERVIQGISLSTSVYRDPQAHAAKWATAGFVAGIPRPLEKLLTDLEARERVCAADIATFGKLRDYASATGNGTLSPETRKSARADYVKLLAKEYPPSVGKQERKNADGLTVGWDAVEVPNPISAALAGKQGEELLNALNMLEALAVQRLDSIRADIGSVNLDPEGAWTSVADFAAREYHADPRAGEDEMVDVLVLREDGKGTKPGKVSQFEQRRNEAAKLWEMSENARMGDKSAQRECFEWTISRTHASLAQRGAPTIEEHLVLLNDTPRA